MMPCDECDRAQLTCPARRTPRAAAPAPLWDGIQAVPGAGP
jgi:hypothetical protein